MAQRGDRIASIAAAAIIQILLLLLLLRFGSGASSPGHESTRLAIQWMDRPITAPIPPVAHRAATRAVTGKKLISRHANTARPIDIPAGEPLVVDDDDWGIAMPGVTGISDDEALRRRLTKRHDVDALAPKRPLRGLRMQDRSFGGWVARKSRDNDCRELRAALRKQPASAETILETMAERGCPI